MLNFPLTLGAGKITVTNTSTTAVKPLYVYVSNKDSVAIQVPPTGVITITTSNAGESFMYLQQADEVLTVAFAEIEPDKPEVGG